jgi:hypothetical protein
MRSSLSQRLTAVATSRPDWIICVGIVITVWLAHGLSASFTIVSDDAEWVTTAQHYVEARQPWKAFEQNIGGNFYRPVPMLSFITDVALFGRNTVALHVDQILLFSALCVLIYFWLKDITRRRDVAYLAAVLFAVYPSHHEVVSWLAGRPDLLAMLWLVGSSWCGTRWLMTNNRRWLSGLIVGSVLAVMSKESGFVIPAVHVLTLLMFWSQGRRVSWRKTLFVLSITSLCVIGILVVRSQILTDAIGGYIRGGDISGLHIEWRDVRAPFTSMTMLINIPYLRSILGKVFEFFGTGRFILGVTGLVGVIGLGAIWIGRKRRDLLRILGFSLGLSIVLFIPALGLSTAVSSDLEGSRLFFGPSIGYALLWTTLIMMLSQHRTRLRASIAGIVTFVFLVLCLINAQPWRQSSTFVRHVEQRLTEQRAEMIPTGTTDVVAGGMTGRIFGAYAFWGPHIITYAIQQSAGSNLHVYVRSVKAYPETPFCLSEKMNRRTAVIRWDTTRDTWMRNRDEEALVSASQPATSPQIFRPQSPGWNSGSMVGITDANGTTYTLQHASDAIQLTPDKVFPAASYRAVIVHIVNRQGIRGFGTRQATLTWYSDRQDIRPQQLTFTLPEHDTTFTIPLCQYPNWVLTPSIRRIDIQPQQTGTFTISSIELVP